MFRSVLPVTCMLHISIFNTCAEPVSMSIIHGYMNYFMFYAIGEHYVKCRYLLYGCTLFYLLIIVDKWVSY
ncbi:uncharacterized protein M6B38_401195 [Iris pallida]|uniref:Uncharacterized protein n=1 Tax=Iris pallida TaxID=29817 RepID=A0AAX6FTP3_IRIPA|nr:uncharacterized protein M6B38_401195 [Iris pallida]